MQEQILTYLDANSFADEIRPAAADGTTTTLPRAVILGSGAWDVEHVQAYTNWSDAELVRRYAAAVKRIAESADSFIERHPDSMVVWRLTTHRADSDEGRANLLVDSMNAAAMPILKRSSMTILDASALMRDAKRLMWQCPASLYGRDIPEARQCPKSWHFHRVAGPNVFNPGEGGFVLMHLLLNMVCKS